MLLYHGTSALNLDSILKKGILPRGRKKGNWEEFPSHKKLVYLTKAYPFYFAGCSLKKSEKALVLEIDTDLLDENNLFPDEDFIAQSSGDQFGKTSKIRQANILRQLDGLRHYWKLSLEKIGNCGHLGTILPKAIVRYCLFDTRERKDITLQMMDPSISTINYFFCGEQYRGMVAWMFGDVASLPDDTNGLIGENWQKRRDFIKKQSDDRSGIEVFKVEGV